MIQGLSGHCSTPIMKGGVTGHQRNHTRRGINVRVLELKAYILPGWAERQSRDIVYRSLAAYGAGRGGAGRAVASAHAQLFCVVALKKHPGHCHR